MPDAIDSDLTALRDTLNTLDPDPGYSRDAQERAAAEYMTQRLGRQRQVTDATGQPEDDWHDVEREIRATYPLARTDGFEKHYRHETRRAASDGMIDRYSRAYQEAGTDWADWLRRRLPAGGGQIHEALDNRAVTQAFERVRNGGTRDEDHRKVGEYIARLRQMEEAGFWGQAFDAISRQPAFMIDFAATAGVASATRAAATRGLTRLAGEAAATTLPAQAVVGLAGITAQTAAMPANVAAATTRGMMPRELGGQGQGFGQALGEGFLDQLIETGSEYSGALLPGAPHARPSVTRLGRVRNAVLQGGYHGVLGEMFEERVGELARIGTGLARTPDGQLDGGVIGALVRGDLAEAGKQLGIEAVSFAAPGAVHNAGEIRRWLGQRGVPLMGGPSMLDRPAVQQWLQTAPPEELRRWRDYWALDGLQGEIDQLIQQRQQNPAAAREAASGLAPEITAKLTEQVQNGQSETASPQAAQEAPQTPSTGQAAQTPTETPGTPPGAAPTQETATQSTPVQSTSSPMSPEEASAAIAREEARQPTPNQAGVERQVGERFNAQPVAPTPEQMPAVERVTGRQTLIATPSAPEGVPATYEVRELADLKASHDISTGQPRATEGYPAGLQPRAYEPGSEEAEKVDRNLRAQQPEYWLSTHPGADNGPPTISPEGTVLNGNSRVMTLQLGHSRGNLDWYRRPLEQQAQQFGIDPEQIRRMKAPVLVRVVGMNPHGPEAQRFAREGNVSATAAQSPVRAAAALGGLIDEETLTGALHLGDDTTFSEMVADPKAGREFRRRLYQAIPATERARYLTEQGELTDSGKELVRNLLLSKLLPVSVLERMADRRKQLKRTLEAALPQLLQAQRELRSQLGQDPGIDKQLAEAVDFLVRNPEVTSLAGLENTLAQGDLFTGKYAQISPVGNLLTAYMVEYGGKPIVFRRKLVQFLHDANSPLLSQESPEQTAEHALAELRGQILQSKKEEQRGGPLFAGAPAAPLPEPAPSAARVTQEPPLSAEQRRIEGLRHQDFDALSAEADQRVNEAEGRQPAEPAVVRAPKAEVTRRTKARSPYARRTEAQVKADSDYDDVYNAYAQIFDPQPGESYTPQEVDEIVQELKENANVQVVDRETEVLRQASLDVMADYAVQVSQVLKEQADAKKGKRGRRARSGEQAFQGNVSITVANGAQGRVSNHAIVLALGKAFSVPIRYGRIVTQALGIYKQHPEVVRLRNGYAGDLSVTTHEVAHHLDKTTDVRTSLTDPFAIGELAALDYDPKRQDPLEGFAEFVRLYLTTDGLALQNAPRLHAHFEQWLAANDGYRQKFLEARQLIDLWRNQGSEARMQANLFRLGEKPTPAGETARDRIGDDLFGAWNRTVAAMKDEMRYLDVFEHEAKQRGYTPAAGEGPVALARALAQTGPSMAARALKDGVFTVSANMKKIGPGLAEVFKGLSPEAVQKLKLFLVARQAAEMEQKGVKSGFLAQDIQAVLRQHGSQDFERRAQQFRAFHGALIDMGVDAGIWTPEEGKAIKDSYENYVPFKRVREGVLGAMTRKTRRTQLLDAPELVKRRTGSDRPIVDPVDATVQMAVEFYTRAAQQQVTNEILKAYRTTEGLGEFVEIVPPKNEQTQFSLGEIRKQLEAHGIDPLALDQAAASAMLRVFRPVNRGSKQEAIGRVIENGKPVLVQMHPDLYRFAAGMEVTELPLFLKPLAALNRLTKLGATGINVAFGLRNPIRDYPNYIANVKNHPSEAKAAAMPAVAVAAYIKSKLSEARGGQANVYVQLWEEMGGPLGSELGLDRRSIRHFADDLAELPKSLKRVALETPGKALDMLRGAIGVSEVGPRLAQFTFTLQKHGYTEQRLEQMRQQGQSPSRAVLVEAINDAHEVTVDFRRMGYLGKQINQIVPFFNANLEGTARFLRTWRENPKRALVMTAAVMAKALAYWWLVKDDDWWKEAPPWQKYGYFTFTDGRGNPWLRIPMSQEWGVQVAGVAIASAEAAYRQNPSSLRDWMGQSAQQIMPPVAPVGVRAAVESYFGWDFFRGRALEGPQLEERRPGDRFHPWNTEVMKAIGGYLNVSPAKLDHFLDSTTGGLWGRSVRAVERRDAESLREIAGIGGVTLRRDYSRSVDAFYEDRARLRQDVTSANVRGYPPAELARQDARFQALGHLMSDLRGLVPDRTQDRDVRFEHERYLIGLARFAEGKEELARYPNPLRDRGAPADVREVVDRFLLTQIREATASVPVRHNGERQADYTERRDDWQEKVSRASRLLNDAGLSQEELARILREGMRRTHGPSSDLQRRLGALRRVTQ